MYPIRIPLYAPGGEPRGTASINLRVHSLSAMHAVLEFVVSEQDEKEKNTGMLQQAKPNIVWWPLTGELHFSALQDAFTRLCTSCIVLPYGAQNFPLHVPGRI